MAVAAVTPISEHWGLRPYALALYTYCVETSDGVCLGYWVARSPEDARTRAREACVWVSVIEKLKTTEVR